MKNVKKASRNLLQTSKEFVGGKWVKVGFYEHKRTGEVYVRRITK
jgi:hypothetical protein